MRAPIVLHNFGKVYEGELWRRLPPGPERTLLAEERAKGHGMHDAAVVLQKAYGEEALTRVAAEAMRADPLGYARLCAKLVPRTFYEDSFYMPYWDRTRAAWLGPLNAWRGWFGRWSRPSFALFVLLVTAACMTGLGAPVGIPAWRHLFAPYLVALFGSIALSSWTYEIGRFAVSFHPLQALRWAQLAGSLTAAVGALARRRVTTEERQRAELRPPAAPYPLDDR